MKTPLVIAALLLAASCSSGPGPSSVATTTAVGASPPTSVTTAPASGGGAGWTTYLHDSGRSGVSTEGPANPASVHQQWVTAPLDGDVYAQPLVVGDRLIAATENDTVYALNAATGAVLWHQHLGTPVAASSLPCGNVDPVGITSTPVVDAAASRVYAVGLVQPGRHTLFALDLATGSVVASTAVDAPGADPTIHNQRAALTLAGGAVLVPFGGRFGDCGDYHGRLTSVPVTATGLGTATWYTLPTSREGGFWAPAGVVVAADGSYFVTSGNSGGSATYDYGNSVAHLSAGLKLLDSFAPTNWAALNSTDADLGSTNPVLVGGNRVFQVGKAGVGYLLDAAHLGGIGGQLASAKVCNGPAFGAVSHLGTVLFVPCPGGVAAVDVAGDGLTVKWTATVSTPGPVVVTSGTTAAVWTVATGSGDLVAVGVATGRQLWSQPIGSVPSRFTSPAVGGGRVVVAADRKVMAFGD